jgi:hypothetical protein
MYGRTTRRILAERHYSDTFLRKWSHETSFPVFLIWIINKWRTLKWLIIHYSLSFDPTEMFFNYVINILSRVGVWLQTRFGLVIGFIEILQNVTASNYSAITNSHTQQFTTARTKSSQSPGFQRRSSNKSQSHIATDGQSVSKSWCRAPSGAHGQIFFTVWQLRSCFLRAPSLTRKRVCLFLCCWALPAQFFSGPSPRGHISVSDLRLPFSSPPTTRRITVEVCEPAFTRVAP